jgi:hypothetical protein
MNIRRFQRKRTKNHGHPNNWVFVTRPSRFSNPYKEKDGYTCQGCVDLFKADLFAGKLAFTADDVKKELKGKNIGCYCEIGTPCHGDVLLEIVNTP